MNFSSSAALQARSVFALLMRRIRSEYSGSRAGYAWALIEPVVWVFALKLAFQHGSSSQAPVGDSFEVFFATGIMLARTWRMCVNQIAGVLARPASGSLPSIHRLDLVLALWLLEMATGLVVLTLILVVLGLFGFEAIPGDILMCLMAFAGMAIYALAFGLMLALIETVAPGLRHFRGILLIIMFVTSGFSFVLDRMPIAIRNIISWNPLVHCVEWFREGFYTGYECRSLALVYLFTVTVVFLLFGLVGERAFRRKTRDNASNYGGDEF